MDAVETSIVGTRDYRAVLRQELNCRKQQNPMYSQRAFARDLGLSSPRLTEILKCKQGLSPAVAGSIAVRLGLTLEEGAYFVDLVRMQHARSRREREEALSRIAAQDGGEEYRVLDLSAFQVLSDWLPFAMLELIQSSGFRPSVSYVANRLQVSESRVESSLEHLKKLGLLKIENETWIPLASNTLTARGVPSRAIKNFHRHAMERALHALYRDPMDQREFSSLVVGVDRRRLPELKKRIREFVSQMDREFRGKSKTTDVACLSLQMFLLSGESR